MKHAAVLAQLCRDAGFSPAEFAARAATGKSIVPCDDPQKRRFFHRSYRIKLGMAASESFGKDRPKRWNGRENEQSAVAKKGTASSALVRGARSRAINSWIIGPIRELQAKKKKLREIAKQLNDDGYRPSRGEFFLPQTIAKIIKQFKGIETPALTIC